MPTITAKLAGGILTGLLLASPLAPAAASSLSGAYLAAMQADFRDDYRVAAEYYDRTLEADPANFALMQNALVARVAIGDMAVAGPLADRLAEIQPDNQLAGLVRLASAIHDGEFDEAEQILASATPRVFNPLLAGLVAGWIEVGREDFPAARARFDAMRANEALLAYGQYHKALALAMAGDFVSAEAILAGDERGPLHLTRSALIAHAEVLAQIGQEPEALTILDEAIAGGLPDATLIGLRDRIAGGEEVPFGRVTEAKDGVAEAYLTLAEALNTDETERVSLLHARLAAYIRPALIEADLLAAELFENDERYALATEVLAHVPEESPWYVTTEIRRASTQRDSGDIEGGIATLLALTSTHGDHVEAQSALGDAYRSNEQFAEAVDAYTRAIDLVGDPSAIHWVLRYTRGVANERAGRWADAEADFREALRLSPDQPLVLNYLGYSLLEHGRDYDEALGMIERAVKAQPDDGYITDSLGWAFYRLGRYQEAVAPMLRAVELTPDDPVINDHLGDVLWMVGRKREADFQWQRALSFGPADDLDMDRVRRKLDIGLDRVLREEDPASDG